MEPRTVTELHPHRHVRHVNSSGVTVGCSRRNVLSCCRPTCCATARYDWESVNPHPVQPDCKIAGKPCTLADVPGNADLGGYQYRVDSRMRPGGGGGITVAEQAARLLAQGTLGPTRAEARAMHNGGANAGAKAADDKNVAAASICRAPPPRCCAAKRGVQIHILVVWGTRPQACVKVIVCLQRENDTTGAILACVPALPSFVCCRCLYRPRRGSRPR